MPPLVCCEGQLSSSPPSPSIRVVTFPVAAAASNGRALLPNTSGTRGHDSITSQDRAALGALFTIDNPALAKRNRNVDSQGQSSGSQSSGRAASIKDKLKRQLSRGSSAFKVRSVAGEGNVHLRDHLRPPIDRNAYSQPCHTDSWGSRSLRAGGYDMDAIPIDTLSSEVHQVEPLQCRDTEAADVPRSNSSAALELARKDVVLSRDEPWPQEKGHDQGPRVCRSTDASDSTGDPATGPTGLQSPTGVIFWIPSERGPIEGIDHSPEHKKHRLRGVTLNGPLSSAEDIPVLPPSPVLQPLRIASITDSLARDSWRLSVGSGRKASVPFPRAANLESAFADAVNGHDMVSVHGSSKACLDSNRAPLADPHASLHNGSIDNVVYRKEAESGTEPVRVQNGDQHTSESGMVALAAPIIPWDITPFDRPRRASSLPELGMADQMIPPRLSHPPAWSPKGHITDRPYSSFLIGYDGIGESRSPGNGMELDHPLAPGPTGDQLSRSTNSALNGQVVYPKRQVNISQGRQRTSSEDKDADSLGTEDRLKFAHGTRIAPSWSKFPSHTRHFRSSTAGPADNILVRDFAKDLRIRTSSSTSSGTHSPVHRLNFKERSVSFGKTVLHQIGRLVRTESTGYRLPDSGPRSSIATGGSLEYPELEILPPRSPLLLWQRPDDDDTDEMELDDLVTSPIGPRSSRGKGEFAPARNCSESSHDSKAK